ncbi:hypothetical protein H5410_063221 [Solanum commersonii]|uniref:Serine carboxypeptidase-like 52 n=1 Tax=Solanum commersonii TaxID=4109 RepID=A0A9J5WDR2_SOLCO|nr:hypothetical protein H5410_063221 [Solanum commersonii]
MRLIWILLYQSLKQTCKGEYLNIKSTHTPCSENLKIFKEVDTHNLSVYWANDPKVQEALHVRKGTIKRTWARCRQSIGDKSYAITFMNSIPYHTNLSTKGYRSLIYSGDHDMVVPFQSTQAWIKFLNYPIIDDWRPWLVDEQVGGYTRSYSNHMTYAAVKGGGPCTRRQTEGENESFHMFKDGYLNNLCNLL